ncbi:MAG: hypothetical protein FJX84_01700 [Bacteroidetes bacterium]|nr:hypothetical protein [Bacteroidota bacterium]
MKFLAKLRPLQIFLLSFFCITTPLFLFPINLFPGIIEINQGKSSVEAPLSLSYFIGLGYDSQDLKELHVTDFYLTLKGKILAIIFLLGFPGILSYASFIYRKKG